MNDTMDAHHTSSRLDTEAKTGDLNQLLTSHKGVLNQVWQALRLCLCEDGMESDLNLIPRPELAAYQLIRDSFDGSETLAGEWRDSQGALQGEVRIREDGNVYAEVNVIRRHPTDVRWFVEAVTAWGNADGLKTELRLLPSV